MKNVSFAAIARLLAFDAPEFVTSKYALSNSAPIHFDWAHQIYLALRTDRPSSQMASSVRVGPTRICLGLPTWLEKRKGLARTGRTTAWRTIDADQRDSESRGYGISQPVADLAVAKLLE